MIRLTLSLAAGLLLGAAAMTASAQATNPFELDDWKLGLPLDADGDGKSDEISATELAEGWRDSRFFFDSGDGGISFRSPVRGTTTSSNTKYVRTELREMLRRGNTRPKTSGLSKNNWNFSSAPRRSLRKLGGVDGELHAELKIDHVTTTGDKSQIGRVIIGQIHGKDDEPARLYYRKLPGHTNGSLYFMHEVKGQEKDLLIPLLGDRANGAPNPVDGIPLGERFGYSIVAMGHALQVTIIRDGKPVARKQIDMSESGYDAKDEYMYFKAGVYNQNNTGDDTDYAQATFYTLKNLHGRPPK